MTEAERRARALALIDELCGEPDAAADRFAEVLRGYAAAVGWVRTLYGDCPTSDSIIERLNVVSGQLRSVDDPRDPAMVLIQEAVEAVTGCRTAAAAVMKAAA